MNFLDRSAWAEMFARYYLVLAQTGRWSELVDRGGLLYATNRHSNPMTIAATEHRADAIASAQCSRRAMWHGVR